MLWLFILEDFEEGRFGFSGREDAVNLSHLLMSDPGSLNFGIRLVLDYFLLQHLIRYPHH